MVYGSVEYLNDKKNKVDTEHFPGCLLALYICNSDLRRWKKAGGGVVWRSEQQPEQSPNCQNHVVVKFFHPRGFDSWRGWFVAPCVNDLRTVRRTTWCNDANYNRTIISIVDNHWPPSRHRCSELLGASTTCGKSTHPDAPHFSSSNSKLNKRVADLFCISIERVTYYY